MIILTSSSSSSSGCGGSTAGASAVPGLVLVHVPGSGPHVVWSGGWRSLPVPLLHPGGEQTAPAGLGGRRGNVSDAD